VCLLAATLVGCQSIGNPIAPTDTRAKRADRTRAELQTRLGVGYLQRGQWDAARKRLASAVEADPDYAPAHNALGALNERLHRNETAGVEYHKATDLDPTFGPARNNYGGWLCRNGRYDEADREFQDAARNPGYGTPQLAYFNAGICKEKRGDTQGAVAYFKKSLDLDPKFPLSLFAMSESNYRARRYLSARAYLQRYHAVEKQTAKTLWLGVRIERQLKDRKTAASYAAVLRSKFPEAPETQKLLAMDNK